MRNRRHKKDPGYKIRTFKALVNLPREKPGDLIKRELLRRRLLELERLRQERERRLRAVREALAPHDPHDVVDQIRTAAAEFRPYTILMSGPRTRHFIAAIAEFMRGDDIDISVMIVPCWGKQNITFINHVSRVHDCLPYEIREHDAQIIAKTAASGAQASGINLVLLDLQGALDDTVVSVIRTLTMSLRVSQPDLHLRFEVPDQDDENAQEARLPPEIHEVYAGDSKFNLFVHKIDCDPRPKKELHKDSDEEEEEEEEEVKIPKPQYLKPQSKMRRQPSLSSLGPMAVTELSTMKAPSAKRMASGTGTIKSVKSDGNSSRRGSRGSSRGATPTAVPKPKSKPKSNAKITASQRKQAFERKKKLTRRISQSSDLFKFLISDPAPQFLATIPEPSGSNQRKVTTNTGFEDSHLSQLTNMLTKTFETEEETSVLPPDNRFQMTLDGKDRLTFTRKDKGSEEPLWIPPPTRMWEYDVIQSNEEKHCVDGEEGHTVKLESRRPRRLRISTANATQWRGAGDVSDQHPGSKASPESRVSYFFGQAPVEVGSSLYRREWKKAEDGTPISTVVSANEVKSPHAKPRKNDTIKKITKIIRLPSREVIDDDNLTGLSIDIRNILPSPPPPHDDDIDGRLSSIAESDLPEDETVAADLSQYAPSVKQGPNSRANSVKPPASRGGLDIPRPPGSALGGASEFGEKKGRVAPSVKPGNDSRPSTARPSRALSKAPGSRGGGDVPRPPNSKPSSRAGDSAFTPLDFNRKEESGTGANTPRSSSVSGTPFAPSTGAGGLAIGGLRSFRTVSTSGRGGKEFMFMGKPASVWMASASLAPRRPRLRGWIPDPNVEI